jgi:pilus assembly protein Flp/PilA
MIKKTLMQAIRFGNDKSGATAIEYGLIAAGIAIVIIGGLALVGDSLTAMFQIITDALS